MLNQITNKKQVIAWMLYDWANSAFPTIITTFIFATYFTEHVAINKVIGTTQWGNTIGLAGFFIAVLSPITGAIADYEGRRKPWLLFFTLLCIIFSFLLWFSNPSANYVFWTLSCVFLATLGFEVSMVFYNAMLNDLVERQYVGRISGWGWGFGYFGGLASLAIAFLLIENKIPWLHFNTGMAEQVRACGPLVALWFGIFGWFIFIFVPDRPSTQINITTALKKGWSSLLRILRSVRDYKEIMKFLLARILYIDGLNTIFAFGGIYAAGVFHMGLAEVIQFGFSMNVSAGIGAIAFAWLDDYKGAKLTILTALVIMLTSGIAMLLVTSKLLFWLLGLILSLCVGPIQAASRSLMIRLAPPRLMTEMFGLYAFSGKATAFICPWLLALLTYLSNSQRIGMSIVMLFLLAGMSLLFTVKTR